MQNITPRDPVLQSLCSQSALTDIINKKKR